MTKYRRLSIEELQELEEEFVLFIVAHGIEAAHWEKIKSTDKTQSETLIDQFSDHVFEKITSEVAYLTWQDDRQIVSVQCQVDQMARFKMAKNERQNISELLMEDHFILPQHLIILFDNVGYSSDGRNMDIFKMMNIGFVKSDGGLYKKLGLRFAYQLTKNN